MMEEDAAAGPPRYEIGQDLSAFSVDELKRTIALLSEEIARVEEELRSKDTTKAAAEALFRRY